MSTENSTKATSLIVFKALLTAILMCQGNEADPSSPNKPLVMRLADDQAAQIQIDGGSSQSRSRWPVTMTFNAGESCTATLVGDRVAITAAHCLPSSKQGFLAVRPTKTVGIRCDPHPGFATGKLQGDIALCLLNKAVRMSGPFETIGRRPEVGEKVFLVGYGCRDVNNTFISSGGMLYGGTAEVSTLPDVDGHFSAKDGVVICPGDSGGAAYSADDPRAPDGARSIIGINSSFNALSRVSFITDVRGYGGDFLKSWSGANHVSICGITQDAKNCRDAN